MFLEVVNFSKIYEKIQEAKALQTQISITENRLATATAALTAANIKPGTLKKIVQDIDKSNTPIEQVNFSKNNTGVLSLSFTLVDAVLNAQIRPIISPLLDRNITASAVEKDKRNTIAAIKKEVVKYGMKASDFDAIMKKMFAPGQTTDLSYLIYSMDGYFISYGLDETVPDVSDGSGGTGGGGGVSLEWFDDGKGTTPIPDVPGVYLANIRSGASVPVGTASVYQTSFTNADGNHSFDEVVRYNYVIRGQGTLKVYRNNILHFEYPANIGQTKNIEYEYSVGEPGAWNWATGTKTTECINYPIDSAAIQELVDSTGIAYDENAWIMLAGDNVGNGFEIGLTRGVNMVRFEFTPLQPNSFAMLFNVTYLGALPS